ncbi:hypothetical protein NQ318_000863 [Aromia moschata]|uniref:DUF5641 domain-containing protein n=1 Tax=Aromia moschata TaxID=1265417 RepID=A0AAV8XQP6_9CUCU|nr:hypothetical protein NQ318_000863 [Aromia moschata]
MELLVLFPFEPCHIKLTNTHCTFKKHNYPLQDLSQHYLKRWQRDYIAKLQQRQKWRFNKGQLVEGMLVLIRNGQALPTNCQLVIVELHSGPDGIAHVASIRTQSGVIKRNIQMTCPLPLDD